MWCVHLGLVGDAHLLQNGAQDLAELIAGLLGFPDINDAKAVRSLSCDMHKKALDRPIGGGLHAVLALSQPTDGLVVPLTRDGRPVMNQYDCHRQPPQVAVVAILSHPDPAGPPFFWDREPTGPLRPTSPLRRERADRPWSAPLCLASRPS